MSYVRTLTICLLLVYFVSVAGCHCFDFDTAGILRKGFGLTNLLSWVELTITSISIGGLPILYRCQKTAFIGMFLKQGSLFVLTR